MADLTHLLTQCDKEQIHHIGTVQPFGALFITDSDSVIVAAAVGLEFDRSAATFLGQHLRILLQANYERIWKSVDDRTEPSPPFLIRDEANRWLTCIAYRQGDLWIFEIEIVPSNPIYLESIKFLSETHQSLEAYLPHIAENVQQLTGYDRVMIYRFANDWHGEVVAEKLNETGYEFLGHHFPESDIPVPAREIFSKLWVRQIVDVDAIPINLETTLTDTIDLTRSALRSASPIHLQYLKNMGVAASLTLSLKCDGKLWGFIACHHFSPKHMTAEQRSFYSIVAKIASLKITTLMLASSAAATDKLSVFLAKLGADFTTDRLHYTVGSHVFELSNFLDSDGFVFADKNIISRMGVVPTTAQVGSIVALLETHDRQVVFTRSIQSDFTALNEDLNVAGLLAVRVGSYWLIWFRTEQARLVRWAGNPIKPAYQADGVLTLSPRASFEAWTQAVRGTSLEWQAFEIDAATRLATLLIADQISLRPTDNSYLGDLKKQISADIDFLRIESGSIMSDADRAELLVLESPPIIDIA